MTKTHTTSLVTISGIVNHLHYASDTWCAGKLRRTDGEGSLNNGDRIVSFTAPVALRVNDTVQLHGRFEMHATYGKQFKASDVGYDIKLDSAGLALWLAKNKDIKGIGEKKGAIIAEKFGDRFDEMITNHPSVVAEAARLTLDQTLTLQAAWLANKNHRILVTWLAGLGLSVHQIEKLRAKYGERTAIILQNNPYVIIGEVPQLGFKRVDQMARKAGVDKDHPDRLRHGVLFCVTESLNNGDTLIEWAELVDRANRLLELDRLDSKTVIEGVIEELVGEKKLIKRQVRGEVVLIDAAMAEMEGWVATLFRELSTKQSPVWENKDRAYPYQPEIDRVLETTLASNPDLNDDQRTALREAISRQATFITGSAGSGKTYVVKSIVSAFDNRDKKVTLCAPTGKAARRLEESTGYEASTIHRLLGYDGHGFKYDEDNQLNTDLIVIDETSMVDSRLAYHLLKAIDIERTAIVFVGDHHQLPPVGPGNMLRDLVESGVIHTTLLSHVVRQAGPLKENCSAILNGEMRPSCAPIGGPGGPVPWQRINSLDTPDEVMGMVVGIFEKLVTGFANLNIISDLQILAPQHKGAIGVEMLNRNLQRSYQWHRYGVTTEEVVTGRRPKLHIGDKIIQTKNDYSVDVMNGHIGSIIEIHKDHSILAKFEGIDEPVTITPEKRAFIHLAYALTIHKSQGSEYPFVLLICHKSHSFMHNRNLIYTGATRAKRKLIVLGDRWGIANSVREVQAGQRRTWLGELLKNQQKNG